MQKLYSISCAHGHRENKKGLFRTDDLMLDQQRWSPLGSVGFPQKIYDFLTNVPSGEPIMIGFPEYT